MQLRWPGLLALLLVFLLSVRANASVLSVPSSTYPSITTAVNLANDGDTISVAANAYTEIESISVVDKLLYFVTQTGLPDVQINVPGPSLSIFNLTNAEVSLNGFELNGSGGHASCMLVSSSSLNLTYVSIQSCNASSYGGAISSVGIKSRLNIFNSTFTLNNAQIGGGAIFARGGRMSILGCSFTANTASNISNSKFWQHPVYTFGGAIAFFEGAATISECSFTNCTASSGGAVANMGAMTVTRSSFVGNIIPYLGGAFGNAASATFEECTFIGNSAYCGGAIMNLAPDDSIPATITVTSCSFTNNSATQYEGSGAGGAIYTAGASSVENSSFQGNFAGECGAIMNGDAASVSNCIFEANRAEADGGALCTTGDLGKTEADNCTFKGNTAMYGGASFSSASSKLSNCSFTGNTASIGGGAAYFAGGKSMWTSILFECDTPNAYTVLALNSSFSCSSCIECCGDCP